MVHTNGLPEVVIEEITDPNEIARFRRQNERHRRNIEWLEAHWGDLLPQARDRFVVVANQQGHIADSPQEAWQWAQLHHPEDDGAIVHYVPAKKGWRIYAHRG